MENLNINEIWKDLLNKLEINLGKDTCEMWIKPMRIISFEEGVFKIEIPSDAWLRTIKDRYETSILNGLTEITNFQFSVEYIIAKEDTITNKNITPIIPIKTTIKKQEEYKTNLDPNFTFDGFIEGPSNRFAYRESESIVKNLGNRANNPFVIFSAPGLGKTHLLHAIGNQLLQDNPSAKVIYMTGEEFVNDYINYISKKLPIAFHKKYDDVDCLLLDDIQFLVGKDRTEEEFFYTFNALFTHQKQIILTSDKTPKQLQFSERLSSRLLCGIVAEIKKPDLETRIAILRHKRDTNKYDISDDVLAFIAQGVQASIRELEGCLYRLNTYAVMHNIVPNVNIAKEVLSDIINIEQEKYAISIDKIKKVVCKHFHLSLEDINSKKKSNNIAWPRQIAMYIATELTALSLPEIGREFNRDHSTILHAKEKVKNEIDNNPFFVPTLNLLISDIKNVDN